MFAQIAAAGVVLSNGTASIGVNDQGNLIYRGVGLRYIPTGGEALAPGCYCEGWGVADLYTRKYAKAGEAFGDAYVTVESFTQDGDTATSVVKAAGIMRVTHAFAPSESANLYRVSVKIENISANTIHLLYRRTMDWDVPPTTFSEMVTIITNGAKDVAYTSDNGFADGNPLSGPTQLRFSGEAIDNGPADHGALFDFDFGDLAAGQTKEFVIYYGASKNENEALNALSQVGAEVYSLGKPNPSHSLVEPDGTPNTFIFGFGGVGGKPVIRVLPDLTLGGVRLIDNGVGAPFGITGRIANAGHGKSEPVSNVRIDFYDGDPASGGTLLGSQTIDSLAPREFKDVVLSGVTAVNASKIYVIVDPDNDIQECREQNNQDDAPFASSGAIATIAVTTDQPAYGPHSPAVFSATVTNGGSFDSELNAQLIVEDQQGIGVYSSPVHHLGTVASGGSVDLSAEWNTGTILAGGYRLRGVVTDAAGAQIAESTAVFDVTNDVYGSPALTARLTADKAVYEPWGPVTLTARIQNVTENVIQGATTAVVNVTRPDGSSVYTGSAPVQELYPGGYADVQFVAWLTDEAAGELNAHLTVTDAAGSVVASATTSVTVEPKPTSGLGGSVEVAVPQLYQGDTNVCTETVTNFASAPINGAKIRHRVASMDSGTVVDDRTNVRDISGSGTVVDTWSIDTSRLAVGEYSCILSVDVADDTRDLDAAGFLVKEPPIRINPTWSVGTKGRLLVLLDKSDGDVASCADDELQLQGEFPTATVPGAPVKVELLDEQGLVVASNDDAIEDEEQRFAVAVDGGTITVTLDGDLLYGHTYSLVATSDGSAARIETGPLTGDCGTIVENAAFGDFRVVAVGDDASNDPHGPRSAPSLEEQRAFLENLLRNEGWIFTIVDDAEDFTREFHHGGYSAYLLLDEHVKLSQQVQDELIEAVFRGEGLVVAGEHDERNNRLKEALGLKFVGKYAKASGLTVENTSWTEAGEALFAVASKPVRVELASAQEVAHLNGIASSGSDGAGEAERESATASAITDFSYGKGRSIYTTFDLLAEATVSGEESLIADLVDRALQEVQPDPLPMRAGVALPLVLTLENQGMAVSGQVIITLPTGTQLIHADGVTVDTAGAVVWPYQLDVAGHAQLILMAQFPPEAETISALIQTGSGTNVKDYGTTEYTLLLEPAQSWGTAITDAEALASGAKNGDYKKVARALESARDAESDGRYGNTIDSLVDGAVLLREESTTGAINLRLAIGELLRSVAQLAP